MAEEVDLGGPLGSVVVRLDDALVFTGSRGGIVVELGDWPPRATVLDHGVYDAARSPSGRWVMYALRDSVRSLWWYDDLRSRTIVEEPEPVPDRDLAPLAAHLDATSRDIELAHRQRLESIHLCGETAIAVPRHIGLGDQRHAWVRRDGVWREDRSLAFAKTRDSFTARCCAAGMRLGDGSDVLVWDGRVLVDDGRGFVPRHEHRLDLKWFEAYEPVATHDGMYAADGGQLVHLGPAGRRELLPGVPVRAVYRGPGESLLVSSSIRTLLFSPVEDWVAEVPESLIGRHADVVGALPDGGLVVYTRTGYRLGRIPAGELEALPRRRASTEPVIVAPPIVVADVKGPLVAATDGAVVTCSGRMLRFFERDDPRGRMEMPTDDGAVAARGGRIAVACHDGTHTLVSELRSADRALLEGHVLSDPMRSLAPGPGASWLVLAPTRVWQVTLGPKPDVIEIPFERPIAAATDAEGTVVLLGEDSRVALWVGGEVVDQPPTAEQLLACAAVAPGVFVCRSQFRLYAFDRRHGELEAIEVGELPIAEVAPPPLVAASPDGAWLAWCISHQRVQLARRRANDVVLDVAITYPRYFSDPDEPLAITGLAFLDDDTLVVSLSEGRGNLFELGARRARKLDPQRGDPNARWTLLYGGKALVS